MAMSSPNTISSSVLEFNCLDALDPGYCVDLAVAAGVGSNPNKRKEPELASSPSISNNAAARAVNGVKVGDEFTKFTKRPNLGELTGSSAGGSAGSSASHTLPMVPMDFQHPGLCFLCRVL